MTVRVADVAERAGVSISTVSYVLTGKRPISAKTRERVQRAIDELGYHPNAGARAIRTGTTDIIGMVIPVAPDVRADIQMRFVLAVLQQARSYGKNVLLLTSEGGMDEVRNLTTSAAVDGLVAMEIQLHHPRVPVLSALAGRLCSSGHRRSARAPARRLPLCRGGCCVRPVPPRPRAP